MDARRGADDGGAEVRLPCHCTTRLAKYKTPRIFHVVESLPRTPSGKVIKVELRKRYARLTAGA